MSTSVLVVDDDTELAEVLVELLTRNGYRADDVQTGADALRHLRHHPVDVILLDFELPDITGPQLCRQIREFSDGYVLMLTGRNAEVDKVLSLTLGADDYVTKPFSQSELMARIEALMRRSQRARAGAASPADSPLRVDAASRRASACGNELALTRIEFDLLSNLVARSDRVCTRRELLRDVWATDWSENDHIIDVHVHNLRKKLVAAGLDDSCLQTVRGVGLRLRTDHLEARSGI